MPSARVRRPPRPRRASFSFRAATTKSITEVSAWTQWSFNSRWRDFGMRVANCVQASCAVVIYAALVFEPGPRRRLRRRRTVFALPEVAAAAFFCATFSAIAFGGRPGPPGRHFPRALRRRRRRPFVGGFVGETVL